MREYRSTMQCPKCGTRNDSGLFKRKHILERTYRNKVNELDYIELTCNACGAVTKEKCMDWSQRREDEARENRESET